MRRIAIIIGSDSDLPQCQEGLKFLVQMVVDGKAEVIEVITASIHRNTEFVLQKLCDLGGKIDVLIAGAGWANHLTGTADAYLRYYLRDQGIVVIGVAFEDEKSAIHTQAAINSILHVPGTQVVFDNLENLFVGSTGFLLACQFAVEGELPIIKLKDPKPPITRTLEEALEASQG
jgi:phosphoribosylcarboxyaminoimidazole (NCAIR) mutase